MRELWIELGASMRALRTSTGMSLRQVEAACGRGRGSLSQAENGKAHPPRALVEWYDLNFGGDGLLLSLYAEARTAYEPPNGRHTESAVIPGDAMRVEDPVLAHGQLIDAGSVVTAGWTLVNAGTVAWAARRLARLGAAGSNRLIATEASVPLGPCEPGGRLLVRLPLTMPDVTGTFAAYWQVVDATGSPCFAPYIPICVLVTTRR